ncbi:MAG: hypothetical protein K9N62_02755 [Verrucomicrobia bacterium]|jgi:hypothetical protein|nr:hypothetical protein [Verrucomicrobiota bacterium]
MSPQRFALTFVPVILLALVAGGCGENPTASSAEQEQELKTLRAQNSEVSRLRSENSELARLRRDNQEINRLKDLGDAIAQLRQANEALKKQVAALPPGPKAAPVPETSEPASEIFPIENLVSAFQEAALVVESQGPPKEEDIPKEGDNILIDQSVIELLIPEFKNNTNGGPYEISGWLLSKGVALKNYQQFNYLGITNFHIRRAVSAEAPNPVPTGN